MPEFTLIKPNIGENKEKCSRFHAISQPETSINRIKSLLLKFKEQFPDSRHICYAYRIIKGNDLDEYFSDAGEPNGSAGIPILNVLKRKKIVNAVIFVIRYFGGTKLGVPGLIHAYETSAEIAIENAKLRSWVKKKRLLVTFPYKLEGIMKSIMQKELVEVLNEDFGEKIEIQLEIEVESVDKFIHTIKELSAGRAKITIED